MSGATRSMKTFVADGNIRRGRVVYENGERTIREMSVVGSLPPVGIAQANSRNPPGTAFDTSLFAGSSGDEVCVWTDGAEDALAECGGTVTAGKYVIADSTARIVDMGGAPPWSTFPVGIAHETGAAGDVVRIKVGR